MDDKIMMTKKFTSSALKNQSGFGILEVMIAIVVLSIALLSLAGLHTLIMKSSGLAKSRAVAMSIAQEKLDDLRSFENLAGETGTATKVFGYDEIATNLGGSETSAANDAPVLANSAVTVGNITYNRGWTVECFSYSAENTAATSGTCTAGATRPAFKRVTATITWVDPSEPTATQSVSLQAIISAVTPASSGLAGINGADFASPVVRYTPGLAPEVIPVSLDGTTKKEATKPTPDTTAHKHSTLTTFDEITYNTTLNTKVRDAFFTISCICQQKGVPSTNDPIGMSTTTFDGEQYIVGSEDNTKRTGATYRQGQYNEQSKVCDTCCRDHHDNVTAAPSADTDETCTVNPNQFKCVYDPFRSTSDYYNNIDHNHYYDANSDGILELANSDDDLYYESCRMVRVDGFLRVLQDWRLEAIQALPSTFLQTSTDIAKYQDYVSTFVTEYLKGITTSYPQSTPNTAANASVITKQNAFLWEAGNTDHPPYEMTLNTSENFVARAIYMDYMDKDLLNKLKCQINGSGTACTDIPIDSGFLNFTPFHEVNVTRLANWSSSDPTKVTVTNEPIDPGTEATYSRGTVAAIASGSSNIKATIKRSNTGLTDNDPVDKTATTGDADDTETLNDTVAVQVNTTSTPTTTVTVSGTISIAGNANDRTASDIIVTGINSATCLKPTSNTFTCSLDGSGNGSVIFSNFTATTASNGNVLDNCVSPTTADKGTNNNDKVTGSYPTGEYRQFDFSAAATNVALNITIKQGDNGIQSNGAVTGSSCP